MFVIHASQLRRIDLMECRDDSSLKSPEAVRLLVI